MRYAFCEDTFVDIYSFNERLLALEVLEKDVESLRVLKQISIVYIA